MNLWLDDVREPPITYSWATTVENLIDLVERSEKNYKKTGSDFWKIRFISLDNDLGENETEGWKFLEWVEQNRPKNDWTFLIHSQNPVARERMKDIIEHNGWRIWY